MRITCLLYCLAGGRAGGHAGWAGKAGAGVLPACLGSNPVRVGSWQTLILLDVVHVGQRRVLLCYWNRCKLRELQGTLDLKWCDAYVHEVCGGQDVPSSDMLGLQRIM